MNQKLKEKISESVKAVLPITLIVFALGIFVVPLRTDTAALFFSGSLMLVVGMGLFQLGTEIAMTPLGEGLGIQLSKTKHSVFIALIAFLMGFLITVSEPDLQVLAGQVPSIPNLVIIITVAVGVAVFLAVAILRSKLKLSLSVLLALMYALLIALSFFIPEDFLAVAFDSGGVTTGPMTVPFIMALGVGLTLIRSDKNAVDDSFGLVALSSGGPILAVLLLGLFYKPHDAAYAAADIASTAYLKNIAEEFAFNIPQYIFEVFISIMPIVIVFLIFQLISRRYQKRQIKRILVGFLYTYVGLVLFLCGVNVGFAPVGTLLGQQLASLSQNWLTVPIGMLIGYFIVKAEPAIQVLNHQVQSVTNGMISSKAMNSALSLGVAISVGLAMLRILVGISIRWIIIPGYLAALIMTRFVPKIFVGIAFDSGGVASGPMTTTFLLPLCIGLCDRLGGNIMTDAFGVVALVALTPLIAIQIMGLSYAGKLSKLEKQAAQAALLPEDSDEIIEF